MTRRARAAHPSYRRALNWIVKHDAAWLQADDADEVIPSVTASLVADLFGDSDEKAARDLRRKFEREKGK